MKNKTKQKMKTHLITHIIVIVGFYLLAEANDHNDGDISRVRSPVQVLDKPHCLNFFFNKFGMYTRTLNVYIYGLEVSLKLLGHITKTYPNEWIKQTYNIPAGKYGVVFEAVKGRRTYTDYAIDDVTVTAGICQDIGNLYINPLGFRHSSPWV